MSFPVRAVTLDLDDTLWPFAPIGEHIERSLDEWMQRHSPATARMFDVAAMRALRERIGREHPYLAHDVGQMRRLALAAALAESGADASLIEPLWEAFCVARNRVEFYPDALDALARIAARVPVVALSNGNADLVRCGIERHFAFQLHVHEHGAGKPDPGFFLAACERLGRDPGEVLHVGDHVDADVRGAALAGLRSCWINRVQATWPHTDVAPDLHFDSLAGLADWIERAVEPD